MIWFIFPTPNFPANFHPIYVFFMFLDSSQVLFGDRKVAEVNFTENSNFATKAKAEPTQKVKEKVKERAKERTKVRKAKRAKARVIVRDPVHQEES